MRHRLPADVLLLATVVVWSVNFAVVRYAVTHGWEPLAYSGFRFGLGAVFFAGIAYAHEGTLRVRREHLWLLAAAAAVGVWLNNTTFVYAVSLTTAATVSLIFGTLPIFVLLLSRAFGLEPLRPRYLVAAGISCAGVVLVAAGSSGGLRGELGGVLLGVAATLCWASFSVALGPLMRQYSPYRISAITLLAGCVPLVASAVPQLVAEDWEALSLLAWGALAYSLVFSLLLTNVLWFTAIDRVGASRSSIYVNLQPFLGAVFGLLILSERLSATQVAGGLVIGAGIVLAGRARRPVPVVE